MTERVAAPTELNLRRIAAPETDLERVFAPEQVQQGDHGVTPVGDVTFSGKVVKKADRFRLLGRVRATLELECGRCLEAYSMPVDVEVDLTYVPQPVGGPEAPPGRGQEEIELAAEDLTTAYYRDDVLDLAHMLREQFYLVMPMRPLCRDECRGLCAQCGTNLNLQTCGCTSAWQDPRLAGLRTLIDRRNG